MQKLNISLIQKAYKNHLKWFPKTPIEYCELLSEKHKVPFFFKCDFLQPMGSYCIRGAYFTLSLLDDEARKETLAIVANKKNALSYAYVAELLNLAVVLYTEEVDEEFKKKILAHKVEIKTFKQKDLYKAAKKDAETMGYLLLNIENSAIIQAADGGSMALETYDQIPQMRNIILPLQEESLTKGYSFFFKQKHPECRIIGCVDKAHEKTCPTDIVDEVVSVTEEEKERALLWLLKNHQLVITPDSACTLAVCLSKKNLHLEGVSATILTERSLPFERLQKLVS